jgi:hypothetical protein
MRFEVPQFIEVEAKIIGPLTWKQFVYIAGGTGILVILYLSAPFFIFVMFGIPVGLLAGSLAFHRVNNRPFSIFLEAAVNFFVKNKLYLWKKEHTTSITSEQTSGSNIAFTNQHTIHSLSRDLEIHNTRTE